MVTNHQRTTHANVRLVEALEAAKINDFEDAIDLYSNAIRTDPNNVTAIVQRGAWYVLLSRTRVHR